VRTGSLRLRVTVVTLAILVAALAAFSITVTILYRNGLENDVRHRLQAGGTALGESPGGAVKQLIPGLALQGLDVVVHPGNQIATKRGRIITKIGKPSSIVSHNGLLTLTVSLPGVGPGSTAVVTASQAPVDRAVRRLVLIEALVALMTVALASALLLRGLSTALRPLAHVGQVATRIAAGSGERLRPTRDDTELGRMAASFDRMVDALEEAAEQARLSESAMRRFIADASHELRTPVAAVQATAETLLREQPPRPERDRLEAQLARDSARLGRLVGDLLDLARLEANTPLRRDPVELAALGETVAADVRSRTEGHPIEVAASPDSVVVGDADALARVLRNLVENAVEASPPAGRVLVEVRRTNGTVEAAVLDEGGGVPAADRERIFDGFVRLQPRDHGAGLGLAIARAIARQHGGDVTCDEAERGACFTLRLPAAVS
jgi:signal transduction histidine kinase